MAGIRFNLDLFISQATYDAIPAAQKTAIRDRIRELKALAVKINEGQPNEETTTRAVFHTCRHDEGLPCDPEVDV